MGDIALIGSHRNKTNRRLVAEWRARGLQALLLSARDALAVLRPDDVALGRIDVLPTVDGVEPGLLELLLLERRGARVLNPAFALLAAHDKLRTAARLRAEGVPHPRTGLVRAPGDPLPVPPPLVVKPRFGSWGVDVHRCATEDEARACLAALADRSWFRRHGALLQQLVPSRGRDLRLVVAGATVVGAIERVAAPGEWRTNVSLGGSVASVAPGPRACALGVAAARALACDLVSVDLLPLRGGRYEVLELNGAADFDERYSLPGRDIFDDILCTFGLAPPRAPVGATGGPHACV